jgi:peptidyl-prolyl cis-trans isomerase C
MKDEGLRPFIPHPSYFILASQPRPESNTLKKDLPIAAAVLVLAGAACYALFFNRSYPPAPKASPAAAGKVVMHVNGKPVTEAEFMEAFRQLPEEVQKQFGSGQGMQAFAEQYVRLKLLQDEGMKEGVDRDPKVVAQLGAQQTNVIAAAAFQKLAKPPSDQAVAAYYTEHKAQFETVDLSHIVVAVQGGMVPPRGGGAPPPEGVAMQKAQAIVQRLRSGADFAQMASQVSDDPQSAGNGGKLGPFSKGMLPPEIEGQVFGMKAGDVSDPLPSRYGFHIFKVGPRNVEPLERVKPFILRQLQQQNAFDHVEQLRKSAKVELDPKFFPESAKPSAAPPMPSPRRRT